MHDLNLVYQEARWWLPMVSIGTIIWKTKNALTVYADRLLQNHLSHIQTAVMNTEVETKRTNSLLEDNTGKLEMLQNTVSDHNEKQMQVWATVANTLAVLEDRTHRTPKVRAAHAKK
jgi:hypothetical protein